MCLNQLINLRRRRCVRPRGQTSTKPHKQQLSSRAHVRPYICIHTRVAIQEKRFSKSLRSLRKKQTTQVKLYNLCSSIILLRWHRLSISLSLSLCACCWWSRPTETEERRGEKFCSERSCERNVSLNVLHGQPDCFTFYFSSLILGRWKKDELVGASMCFIGIDLTQVTTQWGRPTVPES